MPAKKPAAEPVNQIPLPTGKSKKDLGLNDNKNIPIYSIAGIDIDLFRSISKQQIKLGSNITVLSGRNGTMKTSLMGLIAHPFTSEASDAFEKPLKTMLSEVFKLSPTHDTADYNYNLILESGNGEYIREPVRIYWVGDKTNRHRVVVSGSEKGDGNLTYNTSFLNLKRLYPLVDANAKLDTNNVYALSAQEAKELKDFYETIFPSSQYSSFTGVYKAKYKTTFAPSGSDVKYDWHSISSGEDNLGAIFNRLLGFQRAFQKGQKTGNGILCIDEFESSLHPVAQIRLFNYLYSWSSRYKVQVVLSTHSLGLISDIYSKHANNMAANRVSVNFISKSLASKGNIPILHNPPYHLAYKELTLEDPQQAAEARRIKIFCEDEIAVHFAKKLISSQRILKAVDFHSTLDPQNPTPGMSYTELKPLVSTCARFPVLLDGCLVLLDADVPNAFTSKIRNKDLFLVLPDDDNIALERRIIAWIINMDNGDPFFIKFGERDKFLDSFKQSGLESLTISDIMDEKVVSISKCKAWAVSDISKFKQYITHYCSKLSKKDEFVNSFLTAVNRLNSQLGIPEI
ncbi:AAA family ATPase [Pseudomonas sp. S07E 245]|uniref:AAA family ATPase n=1 Tax=Pseudomonas sp. S07E 245 TaxID=2866278 RepID=UPI001C73901B|nr:AAA family ATPase [Pseudomonas sp. S07E 245]QYX54582.1 AAA family ATPase [Pseudomonas sp. S07E 245]